jgi:nucleoside 2-deoxyribosyltransferase
MSPETVICPICKCNQGVVRNRVDGETESCGCPVCGSYRISFHWAVIHGQSQPDRKLSAWVREQNEQGEEPGLTSQRIEILQSSVPDYRPIEKQLKLLRAIARRSDPPGTVVRLSADRDAPLAHSRDSDEFAFYLRALEERKLLKKDTVIWNVMITPHGWDYLDEHASDLAEKTQGFVAMSFSSGMKPVWENAIKPAIQKAGYTAYRVDEEPHSDNIIFRIMAEIRNSRFLIADVTEQRNGVYFEAGYALGLGLPVIWSVRKDDAENIHFDTAQYNQIRWQLPGELEEALFDYICAIIGQRSRSRT